MKQEVEFVRKRFTWASDPGSKREVYALVGVSGAVSFTYADWTDEAIPEQRAIDTEFIIKFGHPLYPMGFGVDSHSKKQRWDFQKPIAEWIGADRDDEVIWRELIEYYECWILNDDQ